MCNLHTKEDLYLMVAHIAVQLERGNTLEEIVGDLGWHQSTSEPYPDYRDPATGLPS